MNFENILNNIIFCLLFFSVLLSADIRKNSTKTELSPEALAGVDGVEKPGFGEGLGSATESPENNKNGEKSDSIFRFESGNLVLISTIFLTFLLIYRWVESGHPPLSNLYESLLFLTWTFLFFYTLLFNEKTLFKSSSFSETKTESSEGVSTKGFIGFLLVATALFLYTFATWRLPLEMQNMTPLVPALQSNWLLMHVSIMLLSYGSLLAGSLLSVTYLFVFYFQPEKSRDLSTELKEVELNTRNSNKILNELDQYSYQSLSFAFPLLTLGIISGAVWANEAWGSYWSWDPKETWAFITWLIFAIYLHVRMNKGWSGKNAAWVATFGFFMVWICYLGVNLLGKGLHSYGWWD